MTLFRSLCLFIIVLLPVTGWSAAMKVGDLIVTSTAIVTNSLTASNVIDRFNIRWWGADPTGVTNSTEAISNALSWVGSGRLYVPKGTYRIITLHVTNNFITIYGDGAGGSTFHSSNAAPMFVFSGANATVQKINLQGNAIATQGLHFTNSEHSLVRDVIIDKVVGPGIFAQNNCFSMLFDRCRVSNGHIGMHLTNGFQNTRIDHCLFYFNTNYQVILGSVGTVTRGISIQDSDLESDGTTATNLLVNDISPLVLDGVYFESTTAAAKDIVVDGITSLVDINGMYANGNATSTNSIYVIGSSNAISLNNSYIFNYTTAPVISSRRSSIGNTVLNDVYQPRVFGGTMGVATGSSFSNAIVGGTVHLNTIARTNHTGSGAYTNLYDWTVPANSLTNDGDRYTLTMGGVFRFHTATTNSFKAILGTATPFETGFITASNCPWRATIDIIRTGNSSQQVACRVDWNVNAAIGSHGNGTLSTYATNMPLALVNGETNIFVFQGASRIPAAITNNLFTVEFRPGPR